MKHQVVNDISTEMDKNDMGVVWRSRTLDSETYFINIFPEKIFSSEHKKKLK